MRKGNKVLFYIVLLLLGVVLLVVSWRVPGFSDKYVKYVFPVWIETYSRLTGFASFSVGEIMLYVGACYLALTLFIWILRFILWINRKDLFKTVSRVNSAIFFRILIWVFLIQVLNCFIMYHTTPLYEGTVYEEYESNTEDLFKLREQLVTEANSLAEVLPRDDKGLLVYSGSMEETAKSAMLNLYDEAKAYAGDKDISFDLGDKIVEFDEEVDSNSIDIDDKPLVITEEVSVKFDIGDIISKLITNGKEKVEDEFKKTEADDDSGAHGIESDGADSDDSNSKDSNSKDSNSDDSGQPEGKKPSVSVVESGGDGVPVTNQEKALYAISSKLLNLKGYYPSPKPFLLSKFFSQQSMQGYYFPFSLEANYNNVMYISNIPSTMCHELSHLKGFIFEDEASFISYLACIKSGDSFFRYSALLEALSYVNAECQAELDLRPELANELTITPRSELVKSDMVFLTEEAWAEVEDTAILPTETVTKVSENFLDTNLTLNGVEDGILAYSRLVDLLLKYYYGG